MPVWSGAGRGQKCGSTGREPIENDALNGKGSSHNMRDQRIFGLAASALAQVCEAHRLFEGRLKDSKPLMNPS